MNKFYIITGKNTKLYLKKNSKLLPQYRDEGKIRENNGKPFVNGHFVEIFEHQKKDNKTEIIFHPDGKYYLFVEIEDLNDFYNSDVSTKKSLAKAVRPDDFVSYEVYPDLH